MALHNYTGKYRAGVDYFTNLGLHGTSCAKKRITYDPGNDFYYRNVLVHRSNMYALEFSKNGQYLATCGRDIRVVVTNVDKLLSPYYGKTTAMETYHDCRCLTFDNSLTNVISAGLNVIYHDLSTGERTDFLKNLKGMPTGLACDPTNDNLVAICLPKQLTLYDIRQGDYTIATIGADACADYSNIVFNPSDSNILAVANGVKGASLIDIRNLTPYTIFEHGNVRNVTFNNSGSQLLIMSYKKPILLYDTLFFREVAQFDCPVSNYGIAPKSGCFAFGDQYVLAASDNTIYVFKIPDVIKDKKIITNNFEYSLKGHSTVIIRTTYNHMYNVIASYGCESALKFWSPYDYREE